MPHCHDPEYQGWSQVENESVDTCRLNRPEVCLGIGEQEIEPEQGNPSPGQAGFKPFKTRSSPDSNAGRQHAQDEQIWK